MGPTPALRWPTRAIIAAALALLTAACGVPKAATLSTPAPSATAGPPPNLADLWEGRARFVVDVADSGLPMGESETVIRANGEWWSYLHASARSAGAIDTCGAPVEFPGCMVIYSSGDQGRSFRHPEPLVCQMACLRCPCSDEIDHTNQQQYPRLAYDGTTYFMAYEHLGNTILRRSADGVKWGQPERIGISGIWYLWYRPCAGEEAIGQHPFVPYNYECLAGGPPGIALAGENVYVFVGMGQNPGHIGCFVGRKNLPGQFFQRCQHNPLISGAPGYGPSRALGAQANAYFDFRTMSSADVIHVRARYYMLYEGVRGPGPGDPGDTQFGLGLARSLGDAADGGWEKYPNNPILVDLPGNIGLGHADLVVDAGRTFLFTSLDGKRRSRLALVWK